MAYGVWVSILNSGWQRWGCMQMHATKHAMKQSLKLVEAFINAKGQLYCYLSITWLLP